MTRPEAIDPTVFEKPADDRFHPDVLGKHRQSRPQTTDAAHDEVDRNPGARCLIKHVDDVRIDQGIVFHPDRSRPTGPGMRDLLLDVLANAGPEREWRNR